MEGYNGWKNYETWNVPLWVDNEEGLYRARLDYTREWTAAKVEEFARDYMPEGTPDMDGPEAYDSVDWQEIADAWNSENE